MENPLPFKINRNALGRTIDPTLQKVIKANEVVMIDPNSRMEVPKINDCSFQATCSTGQAGEQRISVCSRYLDPVSPAGRMFLEALQTSREQNNV